MRIGTLIFLLKPDGLKLHPALGLGEDWNNASTSRDCALLPLLHPALGLGEDWNDRYLAEIMESVSIAPGFRAG